MSSPANQAMREQVHALLQRVASNRLATNLPGGVLVGGRRPSQFCVGRKLGKRKTCKEYVVGARRPRACSWKPTVSGKRQALSCPRGKLVSVRKRAASTMKSRVQEQRRKAYVAKVMAETGRRPKRRLPPKPRGRGLSVGGVLVGGASSSGPAMSNLLRGRLRMALQGSGASRLRAPMRRRGGMPVGGCGCGCDSCKVKGGIALLGDI